MISLGVFSLVQMSHIREAGATIERVNVPSIKALDEMNVLNLRLRSLGYRLLIDRDAQALADTQRLMDERNVQIDRARRIYEPLIAEAKEQATYDDYGRLLDQYRQLQGRMRSLSDAGQ